MSITSIVPSPAPQPRPADNAGNAPSAAASAFGAMVDDKTPASRSSSSSSPAPQKPRSGAGKSAASRPRQQGDDKQVASTTSSPGQPRQQGAGKSVGVPDDKIAAADPKLEASSPVPEVPEEDAAALVEPALADPALANATLPDPAMPAPTDAPADTVPGALGGDAVKAAQPAQPADPAAALVTQAVAADAVADQLAATDTPITAPKPTAPVKKPAVAATDKPAAKPAPVQAADASSLPSAPVVAPKPAEAATVSADAPADDATPDPFNAAARAATKVAAAPNRADDTAAREAGPDVSGRQPLPAGGLSSALLTQSLPADTKPASFGTVYAANLAQTSADAAHATVSAQAGRIGRDMGVEIARSVAAGRDEITIRLDPPEMGRVEVRMSFDREGSLRAVVAADNHGALNLLKRDAGDLIRSLSDAGVRSDSQSFRFDTRGGDAGQQWRERSQDGQGGRGAGSGTLAGASDEEPVYRPLRASGRIDMMA